MSTSQTIVNEKGPGSAEDTTQAKSKSTAAIVQRSEVTRQWMVKYGSKIAEFGDDIHGQTAAYRMAVTINRPDAAGLVLKLLKNYEVQGLEPRAWRGVKIAVEGGVTQAQPGISTIAQVQSDGEAGIGKNSTGYLLQSGENGLTCACQDFQREGAPVVFMKKLEQPQRLCKHIIAYLIAVQTGDAKQPEKQTSIVTRHNGRGANVKTVSADALKPDDQGRYYYASGEQVGSDYIAGFLAFGDSLGIPPMDEQHLISWVYR